MAARTAARTASQRGANWARNIVDMGIEVHLESDDAAARGIESSDLLEGIKPIDRSQIQSRHDDCVQNR